MKRVISIMLAAIVLLSGFVVLSVSANAAAKPIPGYYVVGTMNNWTLDKNYLMEKSYFDNHYELLQISLNAGDELKIVYSDDGIRKTKWYPEGVDNNYIVTQTCEYYNIEVAPDYDGEGDFWYAGCIRAMTCPPPNEEPEPTAPQPINHTKELWDREAVLTPEDIEEAVNALFNSQNYITYDKINIKNSYRFNCTPAYVVDYDVEGYDIYLCVVTEQLFGDYLFYSPSSYEPAIFADDRLYSFTKAYQEGVLTDEMLRELIESDYKCGNRCRIITRNIKGDADGDGWIDVVDATVIQRYDADIITDADFYKPLGDVDGDRDVCVLDATLIQRYDVGLYEIK